MRGQFRWWRLEKDFGQLLLETCHRVLEVAEANHLTPRGRFVTTRLNVRVRQFRLVEAQFFHLSRHVNDVKLAPAGRGITKIKPGSKAPMNAYAEHLSLYSLWNNIKSGRSLDDVCIQHTARCRGCREFVWELSRDARALGFSFPDLLPTSGQEHQSPDTTSGSLGSTCSDKPHMA